MIADEILNEIDATLDQLIQNAEAIQSVELNELSVTEIDAFQKTQESLLQHLIHMDEVFVLKKKEIDRRALNYKLQEKLAHFEKMKSSYHQNLSKVYGKQSLLSKRRSKRFLNYG